MDDAVKEGIKVAAGTVGAFVGAVLMKIGWGKAKQRPVLVRGRTITSKEWHDLRDGINKIRWELDQLQREFGDAREDHERDHDRLGKVTVEVDYLKAVIETIGAPPSKRRLDCAAAPGANSMPKD